MKFIYDALDGADDLNSAHGQVLEMVGYRKRVLEAGCATGYMTEVLADRSCDVTAIEIHPEAADLAAEHTRHLIIGDLEHTDTWEQLKPEPFDVIIFADVLEHLKDPLETLRLAKDHLRSSGMVVLSIPNIAHIDARLALLSGRFDYRESGLLDETHLRFFTEDTVRKLLREAGLVPTEFRRIIAPAFSTNVGVSRSDYDPDLVDQILRDPDSETLQFVVKAVLDNGTHSLSLMAERIRDLERELEAMRARRSLAEFQLEESQKIQEYRAAIADNERQASQRIQVEYDQLRRTKLFRWSILPRRIWSRIKGIRSRNP